MLLAIICTKDNVTIEPTIMNIVKPRISKKPTSKHMVNEVSKLYRRLKQMQQALSERNEVYVTSWGIPLNETELAEILQLIER